MPEFLADIRAAVAREFDVELSEIAVLKPGTFPRTSSGKVERNACREVLRCGEPTVLIHWQAKRSEPSGAIR
jgi:hypothetical protein